MQVLFPNQTISMFFDLIILIVIWSLFGILYYEAYQHITHLYQHNYLTNLFQKTSIEQNSSLIDQPQNSKKQSLKSINFEEQLLSVFFKDNKNEDFDYQTERQQIKPSIFWQLRVKSLILTLILFLVIPFLITPLNSDIMNSFKQVFKCIVTIFQKDQSTSLIHIVHKNRSQLIKSSFLFIANIIFLILFIHDIKEKQNLHIRGRKHLNFIYKLIKNNVFLQMLQLVMILLNPCLISFYVLKCISGSISKINSLNNKCKTIEANSIKEEHIITDKTHNKNKTFIISVLFLIIILLLMFYFIKFNTSQIGDYYRSLIFPSKFQPQTNLIWIFYAHMFDRYLIMYQLLFYILPVCISLPLSLLKINYETKLLVLQFIVMFLSYDCTYLNLYTFWIIVLMSLPNIMRYKNQKNILINKTLGLISFFGSLFFFFSYNNIIHLYLTTWMVNIGYLFFFCCIAWTLIAIWIVQLINIELEEIGNIPYQSPIRQGIFQQLISKTKHFKLKS